MDAVVESYRINYNAPIGAGAGNQMSSAHPHELDIPDEIWVEILSSVNVEEILWMRQVRSFSSRNLHPKAIEFLHILPGGRPADAFSC